MLWLVLVLAMGGGLLLALSEVVSLPPALLAGALAAWTFALVAVAVMAASRARREGRSFGAALRLVVREIGRFVRDFAP